MEPPSSSGPKKRGSKEGGGSISAPYMGGKKCLLKKSFKQMYGTTASKLGSSVKKGDEEAKKYLKGYMGGETCDSPPCVSGGKESHVEREVPRKGHKKKSHKKNQR